MLLLSLQLHSNLTHFIVCMYVEQAWNATSATDDQHFW